MFEDGPFVVVEFQGAGYVIDGNNRISAWLTRGDPRQVDVIVICPRVIPV